MPIPCACEQHGWIKLCSFIHLLPTYNTLGAWSVGMVMLPCHQWHREFEH
jgi:hypothetical protein